MCQENLSSPYGRRGGTRRNKPLLPVVALVLLSSSVIAYTAARPRGATFTLETGPTAMSAPTSGSPAPSSVSESETRRSVPVHIDGAVLCPGVYYVGEDAILQDVIEASGGLLPDADVTRVNLAMKVDAYVKIYVPRKGEAVDTVVQRGNGVVSTKKDARVNLNRADKEELQTLPGVGPATADAIILYREENGPFEAIEDLMRVPGIKEGRFQQMKDRLCVD